MPNTVPINRITETSRKPAINAPKADAIPPELIRVDVTQHHRFNPLWPHSALEMNIVATIGFDIALIGAVLAIIGIVRPWLSKKMRRNSG